MMKGWDADTGCGYCLLASEFGTAKAKPALLAMDTEHVAGDQKSPPTPDELDAVFGFPVTTLQSVVTFIA